MEGTNVISNKNKATTYHLYYKDISPGKIRKISIKTIVKSEAMEFVSDFKEQLKTKPTLLKVAYLSDIKPEILRYVSDNFTKSTLSIYKNSLNYFEKFYRDKPLKLITAKDIETFKNERLSNVSKATVNIDIVTLKAAFNMLVTWGYLRKNVFHEVKKFKLEENKRSCFSNIELKLLISNIPEDNFRNLVLVGAYTGCRIFEIINIQHKDVDLINRTITIGNKEGFNTKSKRIRQIPISDNLNNVLCKIMKIEPNIFPLNNLEKYLFSIRYNIKLNRDYVTRKFKSYLRKLNIEGCFHSLRHTFITNLIKSGVNINYVKEIAGHSDIKTTMNYIHIVTEDLRQAVNKISFA